VADRVRLDEAIDGDESADEPCFHSMVVWDCLGCLQGHARRTARYVTDLRDRLERAEESLKELAAQRALTFDTQGEGVVTIDYWRLKGKAEGVALALSYMRDEDSFANASTEPSDG
jgi:hypothetical protein